MTVQQLITTLNKVKNKSKLVYNCNNCDIYKVLETNNDVILY